jgi:hypothetical protein
MDQEITDLINHLHDLREEWHEIEDDHNLVLNDTIQISREAQALKVMLGLSCVVNGIFAWIFMDTTSGETLTIEPMQFNHT